MRYNTVVHGQSKNKKDFRYPIPGKRVCKYFFCYCCKIQKQNETYEGMIIPDDSGARLFSNQVHAPHKVYFLWIWVRFKDEN